ncbi:MAG TPA: TIGR04255 family protein [Gemmatimonadales bacterium]|nr:TIGR04255 family protein [Gemmatimonadales bacterium]
MQRAGVTCGEKGVAFNLSKPRARAAPSLIAPLADTNLPEFSNPPVIEVACSIQFKPIEGLDTTRLLALASELKDRFPDVQQHPPLPHELEGFDLPAPPRMSFQLQAPLQLLRWWFINQNGTQLLQVQHDRFTLNWRKLERDDEEYPHYRQLRERLVDEYWRFEDFLQGAGLGAPLPDQVELTYLNHIPAGQPGGPREDVARLTKLWGGEPTGTLLAAPAEEVGFAARYVMYDGGETPRGRLYIQLESSYRFADNSPVYVLQLRGRAAPEGEGLPGAVRSLDRAHRWIVQTFADITTEDKHRLWGRK